MAGAVLLHADILEAFLQPPVRRVGKGGVRQIVAQRTEERDVVTHSYALVTLSSLWLASYA